jgi:hypothetical protein
VYRIKKLKKAVKAQRAAEPERESVVGIWSSTYSIGLKSPENKHGY